MIEIFIKDIFAKNEVDLNNAKLKISEEQREMLRNSVTQLQNQVEEFIYDNNAKKTVTEDNQNEDNNTSPLRKNILKLKAENNAMEDKEK